jgi:hypothetical protein
MSPDPEAVLAKLRDICLAMPEAAERLSHGAPGFHIVKGKFFAYFSHNHHHDGITAVHVKTSGLDEQAMLIEADPEAYYKPPYLGPSGWVGVRLDTDEVDWERVADRVAYSWELVAPARLLEMGRR